MGLKSGSRDAGLDDDEPAEGEGPPSDGEAESSPAGDSSPPEASSGGTDEGETAASGGDDRPSMSSIPYVLRRNRVNEGRSQVPYFLREEVIDREDDLQDDLEELLGEDVYKSDYREAAMVVAQRNPGLVAEVLREWGYDLD